MENSGIWNEEGQFWCWLNSNGFYHREDGPAKIYKNSSKIWYINGKIHREDGPAIEYSSGKKEYRLNDKCVDYNDWLIVTRKKKLEGILNED